VSTTLATNTAMQMFLTSQKRTLVSVFPQESRHRVRHATITGVNPDGTSRLGGTIEYVLPAAPKGGFQTLTITGASDIGTDPNTDEHMLRPIPVDAIAQELVVRFTIDRLGATTSVGPGIWVAPEPVPTDDQIRKSPEMAAALAKQEEYFRQLIYEGDRLSADSKPVTNLHRVAAVYMGTEDRPWVKEITERRTKTCPACGEMILAAALVCKSCQTNLLDWGRANGVTQEEDPVVWRKLQSLVKPPVKLSAAPAA
jgi:hypothetical protein